MEERKKAHGHDPEVVGTSQERTAGTEHRDLARGDGSEGDEPRPGERGGGDGYGPRTHDDTHVTRGEGE
jgi:hypothetical protein